MESLPPARRSAGPPVVIGIPRLVPAAYAEQEPGIAEVKRMAGYFPHVEGIDRIARLRGDLAADAVSQVAHHGHAAAIAAERVIQAVGAADMRHGVQRHGHIAAPAVADAGARQLRKAL